MEPLPDGDGPDGSSIRPVSSLLARFENMNKSSPEVNQHPQPQSQPQPQPQPQQPPSRPISPAPKPGKLRDFRSSNDALLPASAPAPAPAPAPSPATSTAPIVPARPKPKPVTAAVAPTQDYDMPPPPPTPSMRPLISAKQPASQPQPQPPAVTVQPPQSPPKNRVMSVVAAQQSPFLNPEAAPTTPGSSPKQFKISSRPITPTPILNPPQTPRVGAPGPPSPPPPRRSAELRRDRETKVAPPVPAPRSEKPLIPALRPGGHADLQAQTFVRKGNISEETSPFSSPPSSPGSADESPRPQLPVRPRPQKLIEAPPRPRSLVGGFEVPPVHPALANVKKGRENEVNGSAKGNLTPQHTGEQRPALPARPQTYDIPSRPPVSNGAMKPPPRPPRPAAPQPIAPISEASQNPGTPKRVVSTPTNQTQQATQQQQLAAPTRTHGRSMTIDRTSDRAPAEFRTVPRPISTIAPPAPTISIPATSGPTPAAVGTPTTTSIPAVSRTKQPVAAAAVVPQAPNPEAFGHITTYPEANNTNRRCPFTKHGSYEISTKYDARIFDICGEYVCTSGNLTRVWNVLDGELVTSLAHTEGVKATAVAFKPAADPLEEGKKLWIGTNTGELMEVDIASHGITNSKPNVHGRYEVIKIYRHYNELWTLDDMGTLLIWGPDSNSVPSLASHPTQTFKVPKSHSFSMVVGDDLWHATGKEIRIFAPTLEGRTQFQVLVRPLVAESAGEVSSGTLIKTQPGKVFFGHVDGKVSVYSTSDYTCLGLVNVSTWKINSLAGMGQYLWAAYNTGKICVYDIDEPPWLVKKEWQAHDNPVVKMIADASSPYRLDRQQILSLGADNKIRIWDGLLQDDWLEDSMKSKDTQYCDFEELKALFFTWNAGASTPHSLRYSDGDATFFQDLVQASDSPDILVFGFQELVDLEDKKLTAKRFLKPKKKDPATDQEKMSHQYRDWRDFLMKTLDDYMPADHLYHLLHTAPLVGLFTCVFVKSSMRDRIRNLSGAEVKRGMGGLHGNKGAVAVRFQVDDTSLCFINCHLAAGQTQANARHNDIAQILETNMFPPERDAEVRLDSYTGGGDGSMIMDHELCVLNGDLNYRIDTMSRDTVVAAVKQNNLGKLLERDQLLVARRRNPAFKLRAFDESPITFAPTYKYDVGTDTYDTSEKRRSPAWCDRLLHRGRGRVQQLDYRRHEVRVSDHRPVTGDFRLWVKKVRPRDRAKAWMDSQQGFEDVRQRELAEDKLSYLLNTCGFDEATSKRLVQERETYGR